MRRLPGWLLAALCAVLLPACALLQGPQLLEHPPADLPSRAWIDAVPFFDQQDNQCGPAALGSVLAHWGKAVDPQALSAQMYLPARGGSLQLELTATARRQGMLAVPLPPTLQGLLQNVAAGQPVLVLQNLGLSFAPRWHYATVIGYDLPAQRVVLHSGSNPAMQMSLFTFENTWARSGRWALAVAPPPRLPAGISEPNAAQAAVALERSDRAAAQLAYRAIAQRWPDSLLARMALGNAAYADGDFSAAQSHFQAATDAHPGSADAWNNLAQVLLASGQGKAAHTAAQRAVALGGQRSATYAATLAQTRAAGVEAESAPLK